MQNRASLPGNLLLDGYKSPRALIFP